MNARTIQIQRWIEFAIEHMLLKLRAFPRSSIVRTRSFPSADEVDEEEHRIPMFPPFRSRKQSFLEVADSFITAKGRNGTQSSSRFVSCEA